MYLELLNNDIQMFISSNDSKFGMFIYYNV